MATYSYSGDPNSSSKDAVRFYVGDTQSSDWQLSDEEINFILVGQPSVLLAAVECCDRLIARYARLVTQSVGAVSVSYSDRRQNYESLRRRLTHRLAPVPYAGGISVSDKNANEEDADWDYPSIWRGMDKRTS